MKGFDEVRVLNAVPGLFLLGRSSFVVERGFEKLVFIPLGRLFETSWSGLLESDLKERAWVAGVLLIFTGLAGFCAVLEFPGALFRVMDCHPLEGFSGETGVLMDLFSVAG